MMNKNAIYIAISFSKQQQKNNSEIYVWEGRTIGIIDSKCDEIKLRPEYIRSSNANGLNEIRIVIKFHTIYRAFLSLRAKFAYTFGINDANRKQNLQTAVSWAVNKWP